MRGLSLALCALLASVHGASDASTGADKAPAVVRVGKETFTLSELRERLSGLNDVQLSWYGREKPVLNYVDAVIVRNALFAQEAARRNLRRAVRVQDGLREDLRRRLREDIKTQLAPPSDDDLRRYYDQHSSLFKRPERIRLWRILLQDASLAQTILKEAQKPDGVAAWRKLAREHSLDKATAMRSGDLGFVRADGSTDAPEVRVNQKLFAAAQKLRDGELAAEPVESKDGLSLIWRRGSLPATERSFETEKPRILRLLQRKRLVEQESKLLTQLRKQYIKSYNPKPLTKLLAVQPFQDRPPRPSDSSAPR